MNKALVFSVIFFVVILSVGRSQEIKRLVPWSNAPDQAVMGMSASDLKTMLPTISPLLGMFDGNDPNALEVIKDGMYAPGTDSNDYSETVVYGIGGGRVTQFYWSSNKMASLDHVVNLRRKFSEMHGNPRVGFKARVTKDGIAKIVTEVYIIADSALVISLSSALGATEVAILDTSDLKVDLNELYFSFEKQRERLQQELSRLTKNAPKDETENDRFDVLKEAILAQANGSPEAHSNQDPKIQETADEDHPQLKKGEGKAIKNNGSESSELRSRYVFLILTAIFVLACVLLATRKLRTKP